MKTLSTLLAVLLTSILSGQTLSTDTLHWSEGKKLQWADFKGKPVKGSGKEQQCLMAMIASFNKGNPLKPTSTTVETIFDRKKSWTVPANQNDNELNYYRLMFDIYELHSRMLRKTYKETKLGLDPNKHFQEIYSKAIAELDEHVRQYNEESSYGENREVMIEWTDMIRRELNKYSDFRASK